MKATSLRYLLIFFFTLGFLTSCSDDDDDTEPSKTDILVSEEWRGDEIRINGIDVSNRPEIVDQFGNIKTVRLRFNRDGTYSATYTDNTGQQSTNGNWSFNEDETILIFDLYGEVEVETLTDSNLTLSTEIPYQGITVSPEVRFVR